MKKFLILMMALSIVANCSFASPKNEKGDSSHFFGGRKPLYSCKNEKGDTLTFFDGVEKKSLPAGLKLVRDDKFTNLELSNTRAFGKVVTSEIYRYDGFIKILREVKTKDPKTKQEKKEILKILIDELADPAGKLSYVASQETFEENDSGKAILSLKYNCQKNF